MARRAARWENDGVNSAPKQDFTRLINRLGRHDQKAPEDFLEFLHAELSRIARSQAGPRDSALLQPTALVHEAWLKLVPDGRESNFNDRRHFFGTAARAMRSIVIDRARSQASARRGGPRRPLPLDEALCVGPQDAEEVLALDVALERLERVDPELFELVQLRFFAGLSHEDIASHLEVSVRTIERRWRTARLWLLDNLQDVEE